MKNVRNGFRKLDAREIAAVSGGNDGDEGEFDGPPIVVEGSREKTHVNLVQDDGGFGGGGIPFSFLSYTSGLVGGGQLSGGGLPGLLPVDFELSHLG